MRHELDRHATRLSPLNRADALLAMGQPGEALQVLSASKSSEGGDPESTLGDTTGLLAVYAELGRREDAERVMTAAIPAAENPTGSPTSITGSFTWPRACRSRSLRRGGALAHEGG